MEIILYITAPIIYILIILFSAWIGLIGLKQETGAKRKGGNAQAIIAILTGLATCPLVAVLMQLGRLDIPSVEVFLPLICLTLGVGFIVGLVYIWTASLILNHTATTSLFVMGSIGGSVICLYFYFFHTQVQELLISSAWGFLFGVLVYMVINKGGIRGNFSRSR